MSRSRLLLFLLPILLFTMASRQAPLVDPAPIAVPAGVAQTDVVRAIRNALQYRNWAISAQQPGQIDATLYLRDHEARIRIAYNEQDVRIAYVGSSNLDEGERDGVKQIHERYLVWINYLDGDINTNLQHSPRH